MKSFLIGASIAAPVGPIGILCIRRTLAYGRISGFISGLGASTADAIYGSVAAFGLTYVSMLLINQGSWIRHIGGIFLLILGIRIFTSNPNPEIDLNTTNQRRSLIYDYGTTFFLTLTNPITILSFAAIYASLGLTYNASRNYLDATLMVFGIFLGSCTWWFLLSGFTGSFRNNISTSSMIWVNRVSGILILGFGMFALVSMIFNNQG